MSHVAHLNESCYISQYGMSHISTVYLTQTHVNESHHKSDQVMPHIWTSLVTHLNDSFQTSEYVMSHILTYCNTLKITATRCNTPRKGHRSVAMNRTATHYNTLHHIATHCSTQQHTVTKCNTMQQTAKGCRSVAIQRPASQCNTLQHTLNTRTCMHTNMIFDHTELSIPRNIQSHTVDYAP